MIIGKKLSKSLLPKEYQQVEYIESTGTQHLDLGIKLDQKSEVLIVVMFTSSVGNVFGSRLSARAGNFSVHLSSNGTVMLDFRDYTINRMEAKVQENVLYTISMNFDHKIKVNNIERIISGASVEFKTPTNAYLFSMGGNPPQSTKCAGRIYQCAINEHQYIPCYRRLDGEIGMYDTAEKVFLTNDGTGTFLKGADV